MRRLACLSSRIIAAWLTLTIAAGLSGCSPDREVLGGATSNGACCLTGGSCAITTQSGCAGDWQGAGTTCDPNPCGPAVDPNLIGVMGSVSELPAGLGFGDVKIFAGEDSFQVGTNGKADLLVSKHAGQTVLLSDPQGKLIHVTLFPADPNQEVAINSKETAISLVLLNPFLSTNNKTVMLQARTLVEASPKFPALETTLRSKIAAGYRLGDDDADVKLALGEVYKELFSRVGKSLAAQPAADPPTVNGLTLQTTSIDGANWNFRVSNIFKRWVQVYGQTHSGAGLSEPQSLGLVSSPMASLLEIVVAGGAPSPALSPTFTLPVAGNDFARISCYGLGAGTALPAGEMDRLLQPLAVSTVLDFGFPMISALSGHVLSDFTLTGSIESHPAYPIVQLVKETPGLPDELLAAIRAQDTPKVFDLMSGAYLKTLVDHPDQWKTSSLGILQRVPTGKKVAPRALQGFVGPIKAIHGGLQEAALTWDLVGGVSTDAVTIFRYDFGAPTPPPVQLQGRVLNAAGNVALAGAGITIVDDEAVPVANLTSDAQGNFSGKVPRDTLELTISKPGYFSAWQRVIIPSDVTSYQLSPTLLVAFSDSLGTVGGKVIDAANGQGMPDVTVKLVRGLDPASTDVIGQVQTDAQGLYQFASLNPGNYTALASKTGYLDGWINLAAVGGVTRTDFDLILTTPLGAGYRFVLSWGETPYDLDSHLVTPLIEGTAYHVYYGNQGTLEAAPYASLDVDDTSSYGPETTTIGQAFTGSYRFAIYNYSGTPDLTQSNARVVLYNGSQIVRQWAVPTSGTGRWWYLCDLDAAGGHLTEMNVIQEAAPEGMTGGKVGEKK